MFDWAKVRWSKAGCASYSARLEDYVAGAETPAAADARLETHLQNCPECRQSLDDALLSKQLLRQAAPPALDQSDRLVARVMVSIHEELSRRAAESIWKPLELLASKFAMAAAMVLLLLGAYLAKSTPPMTPPPSTSQASVGAMIPDSPQPPSSPDEIVMSLAGAEQ